MRTGCGQSASGSTIQRRGASWQQADAPVVHVETSEPQKSLHGSSICSWTGKRATSQPVARKQAEQWTGSKREIFRTYGKTASPLWQGKIRGRSKIHAHEAARRNAHRAGVQQHPLKRRPAITPVAYQRKPARGALHPNLVLPACKQPHFQQAGRSGRGNIQMFQKPERSRRL